MKKTVNIFCAAAVLLTVLAGCQKKAEEAMKTVDLRYRAESSYDLPATDAQSFTILVASTEPWTVTSAHPDWCIISEEEGDASDAELVHTGKATPTTIRIQYYDNTSLDDRTDKIYIKSDYWTGKTITVNQKGIAFLTIPEADLDLAVLVEGFFCRRSGQDVPSRLIQDVIDPLFHVLRIDLGFLEFDIDAGEVSRPGGILGIGLREVVGDEFHVFPAFFCRCGNLLKGLSFAAGLQGVGEDAAAVVVS